MKNLAPSRSSNSRGRADLGRAGRDEEEEVGKLNGPVEERETNVDPMEEGKVYDVGDDSKMP